MIILLLYFIFFIILFVIVILILLFCFLSRKNHNRKLHFKFSLLKNLYTEIYYEENNNDENDN